MANYRIPKEVTVELKINKALYLTDLILLIGLLVLTMVLKSFIYTSLLIPFYIFMIILAFLCIIRPASNPKKRIYQAIYFAVVRRKDTYSPIDYSIAKEKGK